MDQRRFVILVADSAGCGALPDAARYGDEGSNTLGHVARALGGISLPNLGRLGLGNVLEVAGVPPDPSPAGFHGKMAERSPGKDTTTGHWEMMGVILEEPLALFPRGFPDDLLRAWLAETGAPGVLGNEVASGTEIIQRLGEEHQRTGKPIVYTSADSVFQVAAHTGTVPLETLYRWCEIARRQLDPLRVARVIARPFVGTPGKYTRTYDRKDFSLPAPGRTVLQDLRDAGVPVVGVGKIPDIYDRQGISEEVHTSGNADGLARTEALLGTLERGLLFVNLVDFDMLYGHRRDVRGYARALSELDAALPRLLARLRPGDVLALTADHGCDPTHAGTDHTREHVPLLVHAGGRGGSLGVRASFSDLGATCAGFFGVPAQVGTSFLPQITAAT
ncbi:phosphopentomutase [Anaeromyxobacter paludicola]|uniref:Phosphopentomutase n=1 Tax=Anaeromyxobacter paludicola TaxID=2918171 RepID=A0ABM7X9D3_9BACT|nr:phosphopentomutase [Anaeromyxobacter paludicola]BDG08458.1 phosphopentomutase [Anaeromyxobacter paludicola]